MEIFPYCNVLNRKNKQELENYHKNDFFGRVVLTPLGFSVTPISLGAARFNLNRGPEIRIFMGKIEFLYSYFLNNNKLPGDGFPNKLIEQSKSIHFVPKHKGYTDSLNQ